jgi:formate-dependent nitrite reductase membrane component NrfD
MENSLKDKLNEVNNETQKSLEWDAYSIIFGGFGILFGFLFLDFNLPFSKLFSKLFGILLIINGIIGVFTGFAIPFWQSPKLKLIQAINAIFSALILLILAILFAITGNSKDLFENPVFYIACAGFVIWSGYTDFQNYRRLTKKQN